MAAITRSDIEDMVSRARRRSSAWQAAKALKLARRLLNAAMDKGYIGRNVAARIPLPETPRKGITVLKTEQFHAAASLAYAASRDLTAVAARLGHTSTRMVDSVYVERYEETGRELADAIDAVVMARLTPSAGPSS